MVPFYQFIVIIATRVTIVGCEECWWICFKYTLFGWIVICQLWVHFPITESPIDKCRLNMINMTLKIIKKHLARI